MKRSPVRGSAPSAALALRTRQPRKAGSRLIQAGALAALAAAAPLHAQAARDGWYASDASGLQIERIEGLAASGYSLRVQSYRDATTSILYRDGKEFKTFVVERGPKGTLKREYSEREGGPVEETIYDDEGRPKELRRFIEGGDVELTSYRYEGGRLVSSRTNSGGAQVSARSYVYAPDGRAVSVKYDEGPYLGYDKAASGASATWRKGPDGLEIRSYDAEGRLVTITLYVDGIAAMIERRTWKDRALAESKVSKGDSRVTTTFVSEGPALGKPALVVSEFQGKIASMLRSSYDTDGRLVRLESSGSPGGASTTTYSYDDAGALSEERVESGGSSVRRLYLDGGRIVEESYGEHGLFARVTYVDGRRALEEMIVDDAVVRSRSFE